MEPESVRLLLWGLFSLFGFLVFIFLLRNLSKQKHGSSSPSPPPPIYLCHVIREMSIATLRSATDNFSMLRLIRIGHSGDFFSGCIDGAEKIVVKKGVVEVLNKELELYACLSDRRLVPLLGYCQEENDNLFLVYEFMERGDLATLLARKDRLLPWIARLKIAIEVVVKMIEKDSNYSLFMSSDVKSSSILLVANYEVRLGSLTRAMKVEQGEGSLSYDVQCFGILLMDLVSGLDVSGAEDPSAQKWLQKAMNYTDPAALLASIDPTLIVEEDLANEILGVMTLAKACLSSAEWLSMKLVRQFLDQSTHIGDTISMSGLEPFLSSSTLNEMNVSSA
ncbi:putative LRR receptor-like serine/threonine-protein kinase At2g16250 [Tasmannia lanceolata]|uniref:putative LRR receptor-like serine/threonine-protein kinase At2g16250 n=1 Tax=Tasmannia lanceolata TaxID=3420 RepID=UPI004062C15B